VFPLVAMMTPQGGPDPEIIGTSTNIIESGTTLVFDLPTHVEGDILVTHFYRHGSSMGGPTLPSGWTTEIIGNGTNKNLRCWRREAGVGGEGATASCTVPAAVSASNPGLFITVAIRNALPTVDFITAVYETTTAQTSHSITSVTQVADRVLCLYAYFLERDDAGTAATPSPIPSGSTLVSFLRSGSADNQPLALYSELRTTAGAVGTKTIGTVTASTSVHWMLGYEQA
jgi:hypothetical protein